MQDELKIIKGCKKGNETMQRLLYELYSPKMFPICLRYTKSIQDAEDVLQEAFIKVFKNIHTFKKGNPLEPWLKKIVVNTALNHNRSKLYLYPAKDVEEMKDYLPNNISIIEDYSFQELIELIQKLPTRCQVVFNLYALEGYKHNEIAEMLEISEGTSKSQYARAKMLLKELINQHERVFYK